MSWGKCDNEGYGWVKCMPFSPWWLIMGVLAFGAVSVVAVEWEGRRRLKPRVRRNSKRRRIAKRNPVRTAKQIRASIRRHERQAEKENREAEKEGWPSRAYELHNRRMHDHLSEMWADEIELERLLRSE